MSFSRDDLLGSSAKPPLPEGWRSEAPAPTDVAEIAAIVRRHEAAVRGTTSATDDDIRVQLAGRGAEVRRHVLLRDAAGAVRAWGSAHDRAAGRVVLTVVVDPELATGEADAAAAAVFSWGKGAAREISRNRGLDATQLDSGAYADDYRQRRWLSAAGYAQARSWWQMSRPVVAEDATLADRIRPGVRVRRVATGSDGLPDETDVRTVHDILEESFADHFNSYEESFDEFCARLREDPGHRWDHWWVAEVDDQKGHAEPAGALVATVLPARPIDGDAGAQGSYVSYIGVRGSARGRGVAKALLHTVIADAARRGRDRIGLEVDAESPTGAQGLYRSMGWRTSYVTESWHKDISTTG
jgi:ribosomal protein S18 acetylase RimI-like enzyme